MKCPICNSRQTVPGRVLGSEDRASNRFYPSGLKFFSFRKSVPLAESAAIRACAQCGLLWSYVEPAELEKLLGAAAGHDLKQRLEGASAVDETAPRTSSGKDMTPNQEPGAVKE